MYPEILRRNRIENNIIIKVYYNHDGTPLKFKFNKDTKKESIDEIIRVLTSYKLYEPPLLDGEPVNLWMSVPIQFRIRK